MAVFISVPRTATFTGSSRTARRFGVAASAAVEMVRPCWIKMGMFLLPPDMNCERFHRMAPTAGAGDPPAGWMRPRRSPWEPFVTRLLGGTFGPDNWTAAIYGMDK